MNYVFLIFVLTPIIEMWLLIEVGSVIGALPTIALVMLTAVIGITLLRQQGFSTLFRARQKMAEGQIPAREMAEGILLAIGGALLLTPGFVTDAIGFACLLPGSRQLLAASVLKRMQPNIHVNTHFQNGYRGDYQPGDNTDNKGEHTTIEGEFKREDRK